MPGKMFLIGPRALRIIVSNMTRIARPAIMALIIIAISACDRKKTTVVETQAETGDAPTSVAETVTGAELPTSSGAPVPKSDNPLLAALSEDERSRFEGWFKKYNLAPDAAVMGEDPDGDGYPNSEEFLADTNPLDPNSMPGLIEGVSVKSIEEVKVPMILRRVKGSVAHIERTDALGTEDLTVGSQPKGLPYKVTALKYEEKADKHGALTDVSNATLENTATGERVILIRDLPARSSETHAVVVGSDGTEKKVHLDETVELPGLPGRQFKVMELRADQVVVEEIATKRALTIPRR